jgi:predicted LPLAT superfamily acyltransferase
MAGWLDVAEVGGVVGIRLLVLVCTVFGRAPARFMLRFVALYYGLFHPTARRASRAWLEKVHGGGRVSFGMIYTHLLRFSQVSLDRLFLIRRQTWRFRTIIHGEEHFRALKAPEKGALLLGAHLGSFEALRIQADLDGVPLNIVGHFRNARMINAALRRLDGKSRVRLIEIEHAGIGFIFDIKESIERGEHVAILGDRVGLGGGTVEVPFMGELAPFPSGVYLLAATLRCPVYLLFALHRPPNVYEFHCELFTREIVLPRKARSGAIVAYARKYAERLEHYARMAPDNWFNFFDFWSTPPT